MRTQDVRTSTPSVAPRRLPEPRLSAPESRSAAKDETTLSRAFRLDITEASYRLMDRYEDPGLALAKVITARGGDPGQNVGPEERVKAQLEIKEVLGLRELPSSTELRDLDHWLNSYMAVQVDSLAPEEGDGFIEQTGKTLAREALGVGAATVTVGYSAAKWVAQTLGVDPIAAVPGHDFKGTGDNTSKPTLDEVWQGLRGVFHGVFDTRTSARK